MKSSILLAGALIITCAMPIPANSQEPEVVPPGEYEISREAGDSGPTTTVGIKSSTVLGKVPLGGDFSALEGRVLRAREVVLLPGAKVAVHQHDARPGVLYVLEGELTEHRNDSNSALVRRQGDTSFEKGGVVHWWVNESANEARALVIDIVPENLD